GLMADNIGVYTAAYIEFVCGIDIDERKIGLSIKEASFAKPNCIIVLNDDIHCEALVYRAPVLDGVSPMMAAYPEANRFVIKEELKHTDLLLIGVDYDKELVAKIRQEIVDKLVETGTEV